MILPMLRSDQAAFEGGLKKQFDGDSFTVEMGDKGLLFFQFHDEVKRDGLKVDSLIDILKRCEQRETRMILDDADVDDSRLLRKTLNKWLHKEELGWKVTVANLSQDVAREVEEVLAYHTNMSKKDIGFRTHKNLLMECMMFQEIADYLIKVDSKLRYVRWLDQDEYVDCCFVPKAAAKDAILPGLVPNLRYKGYCEPAQGKTHRGLSPDPKHIRRIYEKRLLHYGRTIMIWSLSVLVDPPFCCRPVRPTGTTTSSTCTSSCAQTRCCGMPNRMRPPQGAIRFDLKVLRACRPKRCSKASTWTPAILEARLFGRRTASRPWPR